MPLVWGEIAAFGLWFAAVVGADPNLIQTAPPKVEQVSVWARQDLESSGASTTLDGETLRQGLIDLGSLLRRVPGARVSQYGGLGDYATLSLRGSTPEQVTIVVDGIEQTSAWGGAVNLAAFPVSEVAKVRVHRGFGPANLGLGGMGGLVEIETERPGNGVNGEIALVGGELGTRRGTLSAGSQLGASALRVGLEYLESAGDFRYLDTNGTPFVSSDDRVTSRENNGRERIAWSLQTDRTTQSQGHWLLQLRGNRYDGGVAPLIPVEAPQARRAERRTDARWVLNRASRVLPQIALFAFEEERSFRSLGFDFGQRTDRTLDQRGAGIQLHQELGSWWLAFEHQHARAQLLERTFDAQDRGGLQRNRTRLTVERPAELGRWNLSPALRVQRVHDRFVGSADGSIASAANSRNENDWTLRVGALRPGPRWTHRATVARSHRTPSLSELFGDQGALRGNPNLRSEQSLAAEIGTSRQWNSRAITELVLFARDSEDLIRFEPAGQGVAVARNRERVRAIGIEWSHRLKLHDTLHWDVGLTNQRITDRGSSATAGNELPFQPEWLGWTACILETARFSARWELTYTGSNSTTVLPNRALRAPERILHDVTLWGPLGDALEWTVDARNVADRRTLDVLRYPLPDRVLSAGLRWRGRKR